MLTEMSKVSIDNSKSIGIAAVATPLTLAEVSRLETLGNVSLSKELNSWSNRFTQFHKDNSAIFTLIEKFKIRKTSLAVIINHLKLIKVYEQVVEVHYLPNPQFILVSFDSPEAVLMFKELSYTIEGIQTAFIEKQDKAVGCNIFVNSLPIDLVKQFVVPKLEVWGNISRITPSTMPRGNGKTCNVGQIKLHLVFKAGCDMMDIPYCIRVLNCRIYLHVPGKPKICFRCNDPDHLIQDCPRAYCPLCKGIRDRSHLCKVSYAQIATRKEGESGGVSSEILDDGTLVDVAVVQEGCGDFTVVNAAIGSRAVSSPSVGLVLGSSVSPDVSGGLPIAAVMEVDVVANVSAVAAASESVGASSSESSSSEQEDADLEIDNEVVAERVKKGDDVKKRKRKARSKPGKVKLVKEKEKKKKSLESAVLLMVRLWRRIVFPRAAWGFLVGSRWTR